SFRAMCRGLPHPRTMSHSPRTSVAARSWLRHRSKTPGPGAGQFRDIPADKCQVASGAQSRVQHRSLSDENSRMLLHIARGSDAVSYVLNEFGIGQIAGATGADRKIARSDEDSRQTIGAAN